MTPPSGTVYRGYRLLQTAGGGWFAQHVHYGAEVTVLDDGSTAPLCWRSLPWLKRCIDSTFRAPGDEGTS